jgi:ribosomal 30S subunit maturation factor RimM
MTFGSVKAIMRANDADFLKVDGASETARFFVPTQDRRIEVSTRGVTVTRRVAKPRSRIRRFVRVS